MKNEDEECSDRRLLWRRIFRLREDPTGEEFFDEEQSDGESSCEEFSGNRIFEILRGIFYQVVKIPSDFKILLCLLIMKSLLCYHHHHVL
jgi:hypothetical protein